MILHSTCDSRSGRSAAAAAIAGELEGVCGGDPHFAIDADQVAAGVAAFMADAADRGAKTGSSHKRVLVSRALHCMGRDDVARRLLMFGGGLVRRGSSTITGGEPVWILDLQRITVRNSERLDIMLLACLTAILDTLARLWDETRGRGVLGLKNVRRLAFAMAGPGAGPRRVRRTCGEIKSLCRRKMDGLARSRRWRERPFVMEMDHE